MFRINNDLKVDNYPYPHFISEAEIEQSSINQLIDWFECDAPWSLTIEDFYEQYEFSFKHVNLPDFAKILIDPIFLEYLSGKVLALFDKKVSKKIDIVAHKLTKGQKIKIHNVYIENAETHRILLHLNRHWESSFGGYFMVFEKNDVESLIKVVEPMCSVLQGFEISQNSHHAVSEIHGGERFTIIYSFYGQSE